MIKRVKTYNFLNCSNYFLIGYGGSLNIIYFGNKSKISTLEFQLSNINSWTYGDVG